MNIRTRNCLALAICLALTGNLRAETNHPNTGWFSRAKYGVFIHFLPSSKEGLKQVEQFDVKALADQLQEMGAGYLVLRFDSLHPLHLIINDLRKSASKLRQFFAVLQLVKQNCAARWHCTGGHLLDN